MNKLQRRKAISQHQGKTQLVFERRIKHITDSVLSSDMLVEVEYTITTDKKDSTWAYGATVLEAARLAWKQAKREFNKSLDWYRKRGYAWYQFDETKAPETRVERNGHQLTLKRDLRYHCSICWLSFAELPYYGTCPGVPVFKGMWDDAFPAAEKYLGFKPLTKTQLDKEGYQTGKNLPAPCAALEYSKSPDGFLWVYNPAEAVPKQALSDAQKAALAKAQEAVRRRYICNRCGNRMEQHEYGKGNCDRCKVVLWAQEVQTQADYILDSETTGLDTSEDEFVSLAIIDMQGNVVFKSLIQPIDPQAMYRTSDSGISAFDIHGIGHERLLTAPRFEDIYPQLFEILNGKSIIVYNWSYDIDILDAMCKRRNLPEIEVDGWCAMEQYAQYVGERRTKRNYKGRYMGWSYRWQKLPGGGHTAVRDCLAVLELIKYMANEK